MKIRKIEWHQVSSYYETEINEDLLSEIYPDMDADDISQLYARIVADEVDIESVLDDAGWDVPIEWDHKDDDWWTHRKGGYDVTYERVEETPVEDVAELEDRIADLTDAIDELRSEVDEVTDEDDIIAGLNELVATWDSMSDEDKEEFKETMRSQYSSKCECSICSWSGNITDAVERDNALYCPECDSATVTYS
jgi:hypothetical protein